MAVACPLNGLTNKRTREHYRRRNAADTSTPATLQRRVKAQVVAACQGTEVSVTAVALEHELNANLLRRWIDQAEGRLPLDCRAVRRIRMQHPCRDLFRLHLRRARRVRQRSCRSAPWRSDGHGKLASNGSSAVRRVAS
ncbi:transposase [Paraburkholderia atlantica]|uniref:transposase n=1 Tax=Paraburkholderia atlantica TaxID=2654982 RepID=UPI0016192E89